MTDYSFFDGSTEQGLATIIANMQSPNLARLEAALTAYKDVYFPGAKRAEDNLFYFDGYDVEVRFDSDPDEVFTYFVKPDWGYRPITFLAGLYVNEYFPSNAWQRGISFRNWMSDQKNKSVIFFDNQQYTGTYSEIFDQVFQEMKGRDPDPSIPLYPHTFLQRMLSAANSQPGSSNGLVAPAPTPAPSPAPSLNIDPIRNDCKYHIKISYDYDPSWAKKNVNNFQVTPCRMSISVFRCCDNKTVTQLSSTPIWADTAWKVEPCPDGSLSSGVGKLTYRHYFDIDAIIKEFYEKNAFAAVPGSDPLDPIIVLDELTNLLNSGRPIFVERYEDLCNGPVQMKKSDFGISVLPSLSNSIKSRALTIKGKNYTPFIDYQIKTPMHIAEHIFQSLKTYLVEGSSIKSSTSSDLTGYVGPHNQDLDKRFVGLGLNGCAGTITNCPSGPTPGPTGPCEDEFNWSIVLEKMEPDNDMAYLDYPILKGKVTKISGSPGAEFIKDSTGKSVVYDDIREKGWYNSVYAQNNNIDYIPLPNLDPVNPVIIPGQSCLRGLEKNYQLRVTRLRKYKIKIVCSQLVAGPNGQLQSQIVEIDYKSPASKAYQFLRRKLVENTTAPKAPDVVWVSLGDGLYNGAGAFNLSYIKDENQVDKFARTPDGYFYTVQAEKIPIIDASTGRFKAYDNISYDKTNTSCLPEKISEFLAWRLDLTNPCGCQEAEIFNNYLVYPGQEYAHPFMTINGGAMVTEFAPVRELNTIDYPEPPPATNRYNLRAGQSVGTNVRQKPDCVSEPEKTLHPFLFGADVLTGVKKNTIYGLFNYSQSLECYHTSSAQSAESKEYYYQVTDCDICNRSPYFAVTYGHWQGSGSLASGYEASDSPSKAIYSQYRLLSLDGDQKQFVSYTNGTASYSNDVYVINFYSDGLSDKLDIGNFEINLAELNGTSYANNVYTGSNVAVSSSQKILRLIDNSNEVDNPETCADDPFYTYDIVSGSLNDGTHISGTGSINLNNKLATTYGQVYPNLGFIVLDASKLNNYLNFNTVTGSNINGDNSYKFFTAVSGANNFNHPMKARNVKQKTTNHYFVRVKSNDANYSNNPTYVKDTQDERGRIKNHCFYNDPMTYITTVGLYNNDRELLAIAKLSKPIKKTRANDILIKIRLNW